MAATSSSSVTVYHDVDQRTSAWEELRRPISGTSYALLGFCSFTRPSLAYTNKIEGRKFESTAAMEHGNKYEALSEAYFRGWLAGREHFRMQTYTPPGYDVPNPAVHPLFTEEKDALRFGVSLDVRGSMIDCEIKNPTTYSSFLRYYLPMFSPSYFYQVQWAMAIRNRKQMFLVATSYNASTSELEGVAIWLVSFSDAFVRNVVLQQARSIADRIIDKDTRYRIEDEDSPWLNERSRFALSPTYTRLFQSHCVLVHSKIK